MKWCLEIRQKKDKFNNLESEMKTNFLKNTTFEGILKKNDGICLNF